MALNISKVADSTAIQVGCWNSGPADLGSGMHTALLGEGRDQRLERRGPLGLLFLCPHRRRCHPNGAVHFGAFSPQVPFIRGRVPVVCPDPVVHVLSVSSQNSGVAVLRSPLD